MVIRRFTHPGHALPQQYLWPILLVIALITGIMLLPYGISLYHQMRAARIIDRLVNMDASERKEKLACELAPMNSKQERQQLRIALKRLQAAQRAKATSAHTYLLLGRVNCMLGEPEKAANAFREYTHLRPENPMGYLELGFAYKAMCQHAVTGAADGTNLSACDGERVNRLIGATWAEAGVDVNKFIELADQAFASYQYMGAEHWYRYSLEFGRPVADEQRIPTLFKWAVSAVLADQPLPKGFTQHFSIIPIIESATIQEDNLYWLRDNPTWDLFYGDPLSKQRSPDPDAGVLFWNGSVVAFVNVINSGTYTITIRAKHTQPAPILIQSEVNLAPLKQISLEKNDNSWEEFSTDTWLNSGINLIGLKFLNNAEVDGMDRNAYIDWIRIAEAAHP